MFQAYSCGGGNNYKLLIGGDGEIEKVQQYIIDNKLDNVAEYIGWISGEEKTKLLNEVDVFVLPSYNEGLPISILEAMSYNLPIISTKVGGIPEVLKNEYNGYLINPGDLIALENAISALIDNPSKRKLQGKRSGEIVKSFLPEQVIRQLDYLYKELLL